MISLITKMYIKSLALEWIFGRKQSEQELPDAIVALKRCRDFYFEKVTGETGEKQREETKNERTPSRRAEVVSRVLIEW